ncbi:hypothetical protein MYCO108962_10985 [Mycobacterium colombiense]
MVSCVLSVKAPRNCPYTNAKISVHTMNTATAINLNGGVRCELI